MFLKCGPDVCDVLCSWVGYSEPGFEGQQHILEEGEYWDSSDWGGSEGLGSLQPVLSVSNKTKLITLPF